MPTIEFDARTALAAGYVVYLSMPEPDYKFEYLAYADAVADLATYPGPFVVTSYLAEGVDANGIAEIYAAADAAGDAYRGALLLDKITVTDDGAVFHL